MELMPYIFYKPAGFDDLLHKGRELCGLVVLLCRHIADLADGGFYLDLISSIDAINGFF